MANPSDTNTASVDVSVGGEYQKSFSLLPGQSDIYSKENFLGGPVKVVSKSMGGGPAVPIFASKRTSISNTFNEVMGYPASQCSVTYLHLV
jgi:hypothetical protein